jgi:SAM-dependent methyltransferase
MFKKHFKNVRQRCWKLIDKQFPDGKGKYQLAKEILDESLGHHRASRVTILDAGCGRLSINVRDKDGITLIGTDFIFDDIRKNKSIDHGFVSNLESMPLKDGSIDAVVSNMVFEHLTNPGDVFSELSRVLKHDGHLIFTTPSIYGVVTILNRMLPNGLRKKLANSLTGVSESDIFPTTYRANSVRKLRRLLEKSGFTEKKLLMYQPPPYAFVFSTVICKLMICYYRLLSKCDRLKFLRGVIIGKYQKNSKNSESLTLTHIERVS